MKCKYLNTQFGDYDIIGYDAKNKQYLAKCRYCGLERTYKTGNFTAKTNNNKGQCTCQKAGIAIEDKFGRLTVKARDFNKISNDRHIYWLCECECGNITSVMSKNLKNGSIQSCGCYAKDLLAQRNKENCLNITGEKYGLLTAIELLAEDDLRIQHKNLQKRYWLCKCKCGNYHIAEQSDLRTGKVSSCGCLNSKGEYKINKLLTENEISFIQQYTFDDLKTNLNHKYKFDFAIFQNNKLSYLIEYDGEQHFDENSQFGNKKENYLIIQERDKIKNNYCKNNNIPLIRIPYTHYNDLCLEDLLLETSKFIINQS